MKKMQLYGLVLFEKKSIMRYFQVTSILCFAGFTATAQLADKQIIQARLLIEEQNFQKAQTVLDQSTHKESKEYILSLAEINAGEKNYTEAINLYSKAGNNYLLEQARCFALANNAAQAIQKLDAFLKQKSNVPVSEIINDPAFQSIKNTNEWENFWDRISISDLESKLSMIQSIASRGYSSNFAEIVDEAVRKYPSNAQLVYLQAKYFSTKGMMDAAQKAISSALSLKPGNDSYLYTQALIFSDMDNYKEALVSINSAIEKNPYKADYYLTRTRLYRTTGKPDEALKDISFLESTGLSNPDIRYEKALIEQSIGNYLTAIHEMDDLIDKDKTNASYFATRGQLNMKANRFEKADEDFGMVLDLNPNDLESNLNKGNTRFELGDTQGACFYWERAANAGSKEAQNQLYKNCKK